MEIPMEDDRDTFELDRLAQDREGDSRETPAATRKQPPPAGWEAAIESMERRQRVDAAIERMDAEVAARSAASPLGEFWRDRRERLGSLNRKISGGGTVVAAHEPLRVGEIEPYTVRHPEMLEGIDPDAFIPGVRSDGEVEAAPPIVAPAVDGPRFGERLRPLLGDLGRVSARRLLEIADAIDRDAADMQAEIDDLWRTEKTISDAMAAGRAKNRALRRQVEELVEELRYTWGGALETDRKDVLDAEPLLERLAAIFAGRADEPSSSLSVQPVERRHRPECKILRGGWSCDCGYPTEAEWLDSERERRGRLRGRPLDENGAIESEHEPAADRRGRESARNEDSAGRIEGVDR